MERVKQVILYSGGMDSLMLASMFPQALKLYVDVQSKYAAKEMEHLPVDMGIQVVRGVLNLSQFERPDAIIPGRNALLALTAAQYGDKVMLGATAGDASLDKDDTWAQMMSTLTGYMFSGPHFAAEPWNVQVTLPIRDLTKPELVKHYLQRGGKPDRLLDSVSCYHHKHTHCGVCKSCIRKWVALEANGIDQPAGYWHRHPTTSSAWDEIMPKLKGTGWRTDIEDMFTLAVLNRHFTGPL